MDFDLLREIKAIVRDRGLDPLEYFQTLREASIKRWGRQTSSAALLKDKR